MRLFTVLIIALLITLSADASTIFVKSNAQGSGTSWKDALGDLSTALEQAQYGDQIWVTAGTYVPTDIDDRYAYFEIADGVQLYGGFKGDERSLSERNWVLNSTILSGEIGATDAIDDNSFTVVYTFNVSSATIVDGFTITGGVSNGLAEKGDIERCGGGWFNHGEGGTSNPTIQNCSFIKNSARDGGALYNFANEGVCSPQIINCEFIGNKADLDGGAMFNDSRMGICNPVLKDCRITQNEATYGGGILNYADGGESSPSISGCSFEDNIGYIRGGGIYSSENGNGRSNPKITASFFSDNKATVGREHNTNDKSQVVSSGTLKKM